MNILFLSIGKIDNIESHGIYTDLLRQFRDHGHNIYIASQRERRTGLDTELIEDNGTKYLHVRTGNITKCNYVEKGISTILINKQYKNAIKKYYSEVKFDIILYATPPITLEGVVKYVKERDNANTYLLLKDIFPQNAVDIGILSEKGLKGIIYKYFRQKEKKFYDISDYIGCMSLANVEYILNRNPEINDDSVEVCPNCIDPIDHSVDDEEKLQIRKKCGIPYNKKVFVYGGNLGKPQGIPFLIKCLKSQSKNPDVFFLIIGSGTEYWQIKKYINDEKPCNVKLMQSLPKDEYDYLIAACDVGMIFLDYRFTIPNFPSRLLSYMQAKLPVLAVTDANTDIGNIIVDGQFGWWAESDNPMSFNKCVMEVITDRKIGEKGENGYKYLKTNYSSGRAYEIIYRHFCL